MDVGWDDHAAARHFITYQFGSEVFALGHVLHFAGDLALASIVDLSPNRVALTRCNPTCAIHYSDYRLGLERQNAATNRDRLGSQGQRGGFLLYIGR